MAQNSPPEPHVQHPPMNSVFYMYLVTTGEKELENHISDSWHSRHEYHLFGLYPRGLFTTPNFLPPNITPWKG